MMEIDIDEAKRQAENLTKDNLAERVTSEMGKSLGKKAERWTNKGKSRFWIVKKIAQVGKPMAKFRRRSDILIVIEAIEDACDRQDEESAQKGIDLLNKMNKNEIRMPIELARSTVNDWVKKWRRKAGRPLADDIEGQELQKKKDEER